VFAGMRGKAPPGLSERPSILVVARAPRPS
jgi:hypothetical protein